jgi:hypothetical protein
MRWPLLVSENDKFPFVWSPDGKSLVFYATIVK